MPIALSSLMVGDWKSLLSNLGGTGPDPTLGWSFEEVVLLVDAAVLRKVEGREDAVPTGGKLERGDVEAGSAVVGVLDAEPAAVVEAKVAEAELATVEVELAIVVVEAELVVVVEAEIAAVEEESAAIDLDEEEAPNCACLALFLAAAFLCQPQEHVFSVGFSKKVPFWHFLIAAIAALTSLLDGIWPLPVNAGLPSARSINCSAYRSTPPK